MMRLKKRWVLALALAVCGAFGTAGIQGHFTSTGTGVHQVAGSIMPPPPDPLSTSLLP